MKVQHHINAVGGYWYRCSGIEFSGETAKWELSAKSRYSFFEAYDKTPHHQLIEATDDGALRGFVKSWGPLRFTLNSWSGSDPIENYRIERDKLIATVQVLASVEDSEMQRFAVEQFLGVLRKASLDCIFLIPLRQTLQIPGDLHSGFDQKFRDWFEGATPEQIESATISVVPLLSGSPRTSPRFLIDRSGRRNVLRAELGLSSLSDALDWMVWQDVFQNHIYQFCAECRKLFQPITRHEKKFCSSDCAHRKTAREWQQRKRKKERGRNGTQKTR